MQKKLYSHFMQSEIIKNNPPGKVEKIKSKFLVLSGLVSMFIFLNWLLRPEFLGYKPLYYVLIILFVYKALRLLYEWFLCFHLSVPEKPVITKQWRVDVLTTYCPPEPKEMVIKTLHAMQEITYPHKSYLCDEADDPELKEVCEKLGVIHVTRKEKKNAKAGNINYALYSVADGEICVILDPDHIPHEYFIDEVLPYFEDERIGFVQVAQAYYNHGHTWIARAAAQQTYQFYGPMMMGLNTLGAVPAIGANCTFRRAALDSIGGHAPGLTEDMHTSMLLHAKGWKSVYNPVISAKGLVPWNYSGYCLQQLKWARGTFELLFKVLPKIFSKLNWKQKLYYFAAPLFYLSGLVALFDVLIPIIALFSGIVPLKVSPMAFFQFYIPLFVSTIAIRQFNQKWLLENHERGSFILGGVLLKSAWWAFLLGFLYSLIKKKIPYIPTQKGYESETPLKLLIPNFIIILLSGVAIVYGLSHDLNPFSFFMAILAGTNVIIFSSGSLMAMQGVLFWVRKITKGKMISRDSFPRKWASKQTYRFYGSLQLAGIPLIVLTVILILIARNNETKRHNQLRTGAFTQKEFFIPRMTGASAESRDSNAQFVYRVFATNENFLEKTTSFADSCFLKGKIPFYFFKLPHNVSQDTLPMNLNEFSELFLFLREKYLPVFIALKTEKPLFGRERKILAMRLNELATLANKVNYPNIAWVWETDSPQNDPYIEYNKYSLAWLLTNKLPDSAVDSDLPILLWENDRLTTAKPTNKRVTDVDFLAFAANSKPLSQNNSTPKSPLTVNYMYGVAYNAGHDWRDNSHTLPLTIDKLEDDFSKIKEMGANTIRRYSPSIYDRNILRVANRMDLNVLYGFWFDPAIDYSVNKLRIWIYERQVIRRVKQLKNNPAIIGWTLGNESWGLLKLNFNEPYLSQVRIEYLKMIGNLAEKIKKIDPNRPVFVVEEHTSHLSSAFYAFRRYAPNVDFYGVNSYYHQNISLLDSVMQSVAPDKKYFVGEFGPKGYWHKEYNDYIYDTIPFEQNSFAKAEDMQYQWENYIYNHKERNLGGFAFCWKDRYEGTATWFGITDIFGNKKPVWYSLKQLWSDIPSEKEIPIPPFNILLPKDNFLVPNGWASAIAATRQVELRDSLFFKWIIYEQGTFKRITETPFEQGLFRFNFRVPSKKSNYRIYLYVSDNKDNVVTESSPLIIGWR